jgi:hypothetical protein
MPRPVGRVRQPIENPSFEILGLSSITDKASSTSLYASLPLPFSPLPIPAKGYLFLSGGFQPEITAIFTQQAEFRHKMPKSLPYLRFSSR